MPRSANLVGSARPRRPNEARPRCRTRPSSQHVKQAGVQACSTVFPVLGQILTTGTKYSVKSLWNNQAADKHAVQAFVGMDYATQGYNGPAAGVVFASPTASGCEGTMVRVAPFAARVPTSRPFFRKAARSPTISDRSSVYELGQ